MVLEGPDRARSHLDQQGFEAQDVEDLDCEWREGHIHRVRGILSASVMWMSHNAFHGIAGVSLLLHTISPRTSST